MPFCPVCKKEYPSEVTICPSCNISLINTVQNTTVSVFSLRQESAAEHFISYMHEQGLEGTYEYSMREDTYKIYVEKSDAMRAVKLLRLYMTEAKRKKEAAERPAPAANPAPAEEPAPAEPPAPTEEPTPAEEPAPAKEPAPAEAPAPAEEPTPAEKPTPAEAPAPAEIPIPAPAELPLPVEEPEPAPIPAEAPTLSETPMKKASLWERLRTSKQKQEEAPDKAVTAPDNEPVSEYIEPAEPEAADEPMIPTESQIADEPVFSPESDSTDEPVITPEVDTTDEPVITAEPDITDEPIIPAEPDMDVEPEAANEPTVPTEPDITDELVITPEVDTTDEPVIPAEPDITEEPIIPAEPDMDVEPEAANEPTVPTESDITEEPVIPAEPDVDVKPEVTDEPMVSTEPDITEEPVITPEFDNADEPVISPEFDILAEPVIPAEPEMDVEPEAVDEPTVSAEPEITEEPVIPTEPEITEEPAIPAEPEITEEPMIPAEPDMDEEPEAAEEPMIPTEPEELLEDEDEEEDAFSAFLMDYKRNSLSKSLEMEESGAPIIEEIYPQSGNMQARKVTGASESREPKIKLPTDTNIIEAVVDASVSSASVAAETRGSSSSFADPSLASDEAFRQQRPRNRKTFAASMPDDLDETFRGFVPDYSAEPEKPEKAEPTPEEAAMLAFRQKVAARKEEQNRIVAEKTKEAVRKANLVKDLSNGQKIVFEDTDELDNYAGFVPDYTPNTSSEEDFAFYKPRSVSDYSKYKKKGAKTEPTAAPVEVSHMRLTNANEVMEVFSGKLPSGVKHTFSPQEIKTTTFLCSMTGAQLMKLFNSWLMMNITAVSVRTFEKPEATAEENFNAKIDGIKKLLLDTFGDLNEVFLDTVVRKYYNKYLDD